MYILFDLTEVMEYIKGKINCPEDKESTRNWKYNDTYAKMLITSNIASPEKTNICRCPTSHKMWENLRTAY
jgi:hypothetical protein